MRVFTTSWASCFVLHLGFCSTVRASEPFGLHTLNGTANSTSVAFICLARRRGKRAVPRIRRPRRSLPRLLGSPCILQERADGMYRKALRFPCCLSPWLGARTPLDQTWACGSCGSPCRCDTSPLYLTAQKTGQQRYT